MLVLRFCDVGWLYGVVGLVGSGDVFLVFVFE